MPILDSAAAVLRCFTADRTEVTVTELTTLLGMPKSNASRLLRAMRDCGMLETVANSKRYRPGLMLYELGRIYRASSTLIGRADTVVARVGDATGHTAYVSKRDGRYIVAVTDRPGTNTLRVSTTIGRSLEAGASATGRALLARISDDEIRRLYATWPTPPSPTAPQTLEELLERIARVRIDGYALSNDEATRGVAAIAVAVGDPETGDAVSLCITCPAAMTTRAEQLSIARDLSEGAAEIAALTRDPLFVAARIPEEETAS